MLRAVAFLVFLARAARARIIAADFRAGTHRFRRFRLRGTGLILQFALLALLPAFHFTGKARQILRRSLASTRRSAGHGRSGAWRLTRRLRTRLPRFRRLLALLNLNVEEIADRFVVDARHHVFEKYKGLFLEFDQRIFLPIATQPDALFQMVEGEQVVLPLRIDDVEDDAALEPTHEIGAKLFFLFLVTLGDSFDGGVNELVMAERRGVGARRLHVHAELRVRFRKELRGVPLIGVLLAWAIGLDHLAREVFRNAKHVIALVFSLQSGTANRVNRLALLVHHVVVFEQVFARVEVLRFHGFLRVLDAPRD